MNNPPLSNNFLNVQSLCYFFLLIVSFLSGWAQRIDVIDAHSPEFLLLSILLSPLYVICVFCHLLMFYTYFINILCIFVNDQFFKKCLKERFWRIGVTWEVLKRGHISNKISQTSNFMILLHENKVNVIYFYLSTNHQNNTQNITKIVHSRHTHRNKMKSIKV